MRTSRFPARLPMAPTLERQDVLKSYLDKLVRSISLVHREVYDSLAIGEGSAVQTDVLPSPLVDYRGRFYLEDLTWEQLSFCHQYGMSGANPLLRWARILPPAANSLVKDDAVSGWENSWTDLNAGGPYVGFYRDELTQQCWFMGQADFGGAPPPGTGSANKMFQLPAGWRPEQTVHALCPDGAAANHEFFIITVNTNGEVYPSSVPATATAVDLTPLHFRIGDIEAA